MLHKFLRTVYYQECFVFIVDDVVFALISENIFYLQECEIKLYFFVIGLMRLLKSFPDVLVMDNFFFQYQSNS